MAPQPRQNLPQSQPLTTTLANILRDYHAGGTILRELLQNADDAGASRMDFHLSTKPVITSSVDLLHDSLHDYQGPSLIAHNSAPPFSPTDFKSLTHIGDSEKAKDPAKTGKFGIGFNAVYHWTDGPQILSGKSLLILDPHHDWSSSAEIACPGGPEWDVVKDGKDEAMVNQLSVFRSVLGLDLTDGLDGTAVRLPLRTEKQAQSSKICPKSVGIEEMKKVLEDFANEFAGGGYGVFLKAIEEVTVNVDGECVGAWRVVNREEVREKRSALKAAFDEVCVAGIEDSTALAFDMEVEAALPGVEENRTTTWAIQHLMQRSLGGERDLATWGRKEKLFGWVAVAAPVDTIPLADFRGELFTILPLNKLINDQPIHIHGLFSISSDRASLHSSAEKASQDSNPFLWNQSLFDHVIPLAWTRLLDHIRAKAWERSIGWEYWPKDSGAMLDQLGRDICRAVLEYVWLENLPAFPSGTGYVDGTTGLFTMAESVDEELQAALAHLEIPVVYVESARRWIYEGVTGRGGKKMGPATVCEFLKRGHHADRLKSATPNMKKVLLEYLVVSSSDPTPEGKSTYHDEGDGVNFEMLYDIPLFPLEDGTYQSLHEDHLGIYISRYDGEERIFELEPARNLDHSLVSAATLDSLRRAANWADLPLCYRSQEDFLRYAKEYIFPDTLREQYVIESTPQMRKFVDLAWPWIHSESNSGRQFRYDDFNSLWLIPIPANYLSKFQSHRPPILRLLDGETGRLLRQLSSLDSGRPGWIPPLLNLEGYGEETARILNESWTYGLGGCDTLGNLLPFLVEAKGCLRAAGDDLKRAILEEISSRFRSGDKGDGCNVGELLSELPVFEQVWTEFVGEKIEQRRKWVERRSSEIFLGVTSLPFIPLGQGNVRFISSDAKDVRHMFEKLKIASWPSKVKLLEGYIIPAMAQPGRCDLIPGNTRVEILRMALGNHFKLSRETQSLITNLAIVPSQQTPDYSNASSGVESPPCPLLPISKLLDPTSTDIHGLYFPDETLFPRRNLYDDFPGIMVHCGLRSKFTQDLAFERIQEFAKPSRTAAEVDPRAQLLLQKSVVGCLPVSQAGVINKLAWIPVKDDTALHGLAKVAPTECRSLRYQSLVSYSKSVLDYGVDKSWNDLFKWESTLDEGILMRQLEQGSRANDRTVVDAVLSYIEERSIFSQCLSSLKGVSCIVGNSGKLFRADKIFLQDAKALAPYFDEVDRSFQAKHPALMRELNVKQKPSLNDLFEVQQHLMESDQPLDRRNTKIAVALTQLASFHDLSLLDKLMIPNRKGELRSISDLAFWDMEFSASSREAAQLVHESISEETAARLAIQMHSEKLMMGAIALQDQDDDEEFFQVEKTSTRIRDTLLRYRVDATFSEYLANAEDTGKAKCVDWLLDGYSGYPSRTLLHKDLAQFQGQALFVHNNALFLEEDFIGFKNVGEGSKRDEEFTIGQFGRGAQTMFHWTDVPMLISGEYFLVLDPQQKFLPLNRRFRQRYPGLKIKLAKIRETCPDQLAPFQGLWDYSANSDRYDGTIFRFPFRPQNSRSDLTESMEHISYTEAKKLLDKYFETARLSLLFLKQIERISFSIRQEKASRWKVWKPDCSGNLGCSVRICFKNRAKQGGAKVTEDWLVRKQDIRQIPQDHQHWFDRMKKRTKHSHCGIAALLSPQSSTSPSRIFNTLPSGTTLNLPIHIHGTFILSGDRQDIPVDPSASRSGSMWNKWLLQDQIPALYLGLLGEMVRDGVEIDVFRFWPSREPTKQEHSDLIREAFWQKVETSQHHLYPRARRATKEVRRSGGKHEVDEPVEAFAIGDAKFDFLSKGYCDQVKDLLRTWFPTVVRIPDGPIQKDIRKLKAASKLTADDILDKIRDSSELHDLLEKFARRAPAAFDDLLDIVLRTSDIKNLDGCPIVPLRNESLGTLRLLSALKNAPTYFLTTSKDDELFDFASDLFLKAQFSAEPAATGKSTRGRFLAAVLRSSSLFNVKRLTAQDVGKVLAKRSAQEWEPTPKLVNWLSKFWGHFQTLAALMSEDGGGRDMLKVCGIDRFPVYQGTANGKTVLVRPADHDALPTIAKPKSTELLKLCYRFPDLILLDPEKMPPSSTTRANFDIISRFLTVLRDIATAHEKDLEAFISAALDKGENEAEDEECRISFRNIVMRVATELASTSASSKQDILSIVRMLPIVPTAASLRPRSYIPIGKALATEERKLLVPWLKDRDRFMDHSFLETYGQQLRALGFKPLPKLKMIFDYVFPNLPETLVTPGHSAAYLDMIEVISGTSFNFGHIKLAANRDGIMHHPCELLDHKNDVFSAAFDRATSPRFLHKDIRSHRMFWLKHGLRPGRDKPISRPDYLECLSSLENQIRTGDSPLDFLGKVNDILSGLRRVEAVRKDPSQFRRILSVRFIPTEGRIPDAPAFRRTAMRGLHDDQPLASLSDIVHDEHMPYCWTQVPFPARGLSLPIEVFGWLQLHGSPRPDLVWNHLMSLTEVSKRLRDGEVKDFLSDLSSTYQYLKGNAKDLGNRYCHRAKW